MVFRSLVGPDEVEFEVDDDFAVDREWRRQRWRGRRAPFYAITPPSLHS